MIKNKKYLCTCALVGAIVSSSVLGGMPVQAATINEHVQAVHPTEIAWSTPNATMNCDAVLYATSSFDDDREIMDLSEGDRITVIYDHGSYSFVQYEGKMGYVYNDQFDVD